TGRAGVALVLGEHGRHDEAAVLLERALADASRVASPGLESGLAGIAWAALSAGKIDIASDLAERARNAIVDGWHGRGLLEGASGPALLALRLGHMSGDPEWFERAAWLLRHDLRHLVHRA